MISKEPQELAVLSPGSSVDQRTEGTGVADGRPHQLGSKRVLVAIASYGTRNMGCLQHLIATYQSMAVAHIDIVVISEGPKNLPANVRVAEGLPDPNPWSLPFAHKPIFAENVDRYDLFIYSEDDMELTEAHLRAFLDASELLPPDEVAGFLRYERDASGTVWMPDVHGMYRWQPESVTRRGDHCFAEFTNEHAALYVLTRDQLKAAIASGGFLKAPYEGRHDMLCAAATDPYTSCGLRKVICVTLLERFLIHHMSDRYAGALGLTLTAFNEQIRTLIAISQGAHRATTLCNVESKMIRGAWSKNLYEKANPQVLHAVPTTARTVLSIGSGAGHTERELARRGLSVTVLPLDSVIGAAAATQGLEPVYGDLGHCLRTLAGRQFDCLLITNLLHLQPDPDQFFERCAALLAPGGTIVIDSPNFDRLSIAGKRLLRRGDFAKLNHFAEGGIHMIRPSRLTSIATRLGLVASPVNWYDHALPKVTKMHSLPVKLGRLTAAGWVLTATRPAARRAGAA